MNKRVPCPWTCTHICSVEGKVGPGESPGSYSHPRSPSSRLLGCTLSPEQLLSPQGSLRKTAVALGPYTLGTTGYVRYFGIQISNTPPLTTAKELFSTGCLFIICKKDLFFSLINGRLFGFHGGKRPWA